MQEATIYSFGFPEMLHTARSNIVCDKAAIRSNIKLLLSSERGTHFGDPYFGAALKQALFEPSTSVIVDLMIDELYTTITIFMPQVHVERKQIVLSLVDEDIIATIPYVYIPDNTSDLYQINLTQLGLNQ